MKVRTETISEINLNSNNELHLVLESGGRPEYQYIYRAAAGVYWINDSASFKIGPMREWSAAETFRHIVSTVEQGLNVQLTLSSESSWNNISAMERSEIERYNSNQS